MVTCTGKEKEKLRWIKEDTEMEIGTDVLSAKLKV